MRIIKLSNAKKSLILKDSILLQNIYDVSLIITKAYEKGNKIFFAGNVNNADDAQHIYGEFVSRFYFDRPWLSSTALTTDNSDFLLRTLTVNIPLKKW